MVKLSTGSPSGGLHRSHRPAKVSGDPSFGVKTYRCFAPFGPFYSYQPSAATRHRLRANGPL